MASSSIAYASALSSMSELARRRAGPSPARSADEAGEEDRLIPSRRVSRRPEQRGRRWPRSPAAGTARRRRCSTGRTQSGSVKIELAAGNVTRAMPWTRPARVDDADLAASRPSAPIARGAGRSDRAQLRRAALEEVVADPEGVGHRRQRRVHRADAREEARVDDVQVVELVGLAVGVEDRGRGVGRRSGRCRPGGRRRRSGCRSSCRSSRRQVSGCMPRCLSIVLSWW